MTAAFGDLRRRPSASVDYCDLCPRTNPRRCGEPDVL